MYPFRTLLRSTTPWCWRPARRPTGALGIPGDALPGVLGSAAFVGWYNGHPDYADLNPDIDGQDVIVIGNGNVALDCARILAKSPQEFEGSDIVRHAYDVLAGARARSITILGRRGPHQIAMTPKELGELGRLQSAHPIIDPADLPPEASDLALEPGQRKSVHLLREFAALPPGDGLPIRFDFFAQPLRIEGESRAQTLIVERTMLGADGAAVGSGEIYELPAGLIISCIGYRTPPIPDVPYDDRSGRFANEDGRISPGLYCVGWARRGPSGTIGTNKPDGFLITERIAQDQPEAAGKAGPRRSRRAHRQRAVSISSPSATGRRSTSPRSSTPAADRPGRSSCASRTWWPRAGRSGSAVQPLAEADAVLVGITQRHVEADHCRIFLADHQIELGRAARPAASPRLAPSAVARGPCRECAGSTARIIEPAAMPVMADHGRADNRFAVAQHEHRRGDAAEREIEVGAGVVPGSRQSARLPERDDNVAIFRLGNRADRSSDGVSAHTRIGIST